MLSFGVPILLLFFIFSVFLCENVGTLLFSDPIPRGEFRAERESRKLCVLWAGFDPPPIPSCFFLAHLLYVAGKLGRQTPGGRWMYGLGNSTRNRKTPANFFTHCTQAIPSEQAPVVTFSKEQEAVCCLQLQKGISLGDCHFQIPL